MEELETVKPKFGKPQQTVQTFPKCQMRYINGQEARQGTVVVINAQVPCDN